MRPGTPWRVEFAWSPGELPELALAARVPGTAWAASPAPRYAETIDLSLVRAGNGLTLTAGTRQTLRGRGRMVSSGGSGQGWSLPLTVSPTVGVGSQSTPDRFRNHLTLVRPQPPGRAAPGLPDGPWDEAAWRRAIAADLARLADLAEAADAPYEFHNVHQRTLWNLSAICMTLHVPEALPALRRLLAASGDWNFELSRDLLLLAVLLLGSVRRRELPRTAALLVVLGIVAAAFSVRLLGIEMLPPWLALPAAAAGALHLAALSSSRSGRVAAAAFAVGAAGALTHPALEAAGIFVGVVAVATLGHDLLVLAPRAERRAPRRPSAGASPRLIVLAVLLAGMAAAGVFAVPGAAAPPEIAVLLAVALFGGFALGVAAPAIARFDVAVRGRRLPPAFVLVYVVPVGAALVLGVLVAGGAMEPVSISGGAAVLAISLPAVAVSWALGRLLDAAYALASMRRRGGVPRQP